MNTRTKELIISKPGDSGPVRKPTGTGPIGVEGTSVFISTETIITRDVNPGL